MWLERDELGGRLIRPGRGVCEGGIGQVVFEAEGRCWVRRKQGGVDIVEDKGVETLERDIHAWRRRGARKRGKGGLFEQRAVGGAKAVVAVIATAAVVEIVVIVVVDDRDSEGGVGVEGVVVVEVRLNWRWRCCI